MNASTTKFGRVNVGADPVPLGFGEYKYVRVQLRMTDDENATNDGVTLLVGDAVQQTIEVQPGATTDWIPVAQIEDLYVRTIGGDAIAAWFASNRKDT